MLRIRNLKLFNVFKLYLICTLSKLQPNLSYPGIPRAPNCILHQLVKVSGSCPSELSTIARSWQTSTGPEAEELCRSASAPQDCQPRSAIVGFFYSMLSNATLSLSIHSLFHLYSVSTKFFVCLAFAMLCNNM